MEVQTEYPFGKSSLPYLKKSLKALKCLEGEEMYPNGCDWDGWFSECYHFDGGHCYACDTYNLAEKCICGPMEIEYSSAYQFHIEIFNGEHFLEEDLNCSIDEIENIVVECEERWERFEKFYMEDVMESVWGYELVRE